MTSQHPEMSIEELLFIVINNENILPTRMSGYLPCDSVVSLILTNKEMKKRVDNYYKNLIQKEYKKFSDSFFTKHEVSPLNFYVHTLLSSLPPAIINLIEEDISDKCVSFISLERININDWKFIRIYKDDFYINNLPYRVTEDFKNPWFLSSSSYEYKDYYKTNKKVTKFRKYPIQIYLLQKVLTNFFVNCNRDEIWNDVQKFCNGNPIKRCTGMVEHSKKRISFCSTRPIMFQKS